MADQYTPNNEAARRIEAFRGTSVKVIIHPAEKRLLWVLGVYLCFLPWALGTMHPWSQITALVIAAVALAIALMPRDYTRDLIGGADPYRLVLWLRLVRFPIFWLGAALLAYVTLQGLNPSWQYIQHGDYWWLVRVSNISWLPTSVDVPFARFNAWRDLIIYAGIWLAVCAVWVGLTRRRSIRVLLGIIVASSLGLCAVLAAQRVSGNHRIPWPLSALTKEDITSSFIYENHAGAYLGLAAFAAIALAMWHLDHGRRSLAKSTPAGVIALGALFLATGVFFTLSRGASLTLVTSLVLFAAWVLVRRTVLPEAPGTNSAITKVITLIFAIFVVVAVSCLDFSQIGHRWDSMIVQKSNEPEVQARVDVRHAGEAMLKDHWVRGVGAGGFRDLFPAYIRHYPKEYQGGHLGWEHDHCDWIEFPIELGLAGDLLIVAGAVWWLAWFVRRKTLWHPLVVPLLIGCTQTLMHAWFDFPFQCPAVLGTWCLMIAFAGRWAEISEN